MPEAARPFSQVALLSNADLSSAWKAPAAMYFVISVLPISMTSGAFPPASVASNFCRWVPQVWYWTFTFTPGWAFSNRAFAAATMGAQLSACASVWSQTVMLFAEAFCVPERATAAVDAATATTAAATAMMRTFIDEPPRGVDDGPLRPLLWPTWGSSDSRGLVYTTWPLRGSVSHIEISVKTNLQPVLRSA